MFTRLATSHGISERKFYQGIVNGVAAIFMAFDDQLRMVAWNRHFEEVVQRSTQEIQETYCIDHIDPSAWEATFAAIESALSGEPFSSLELSIVTSSGTTIPHLISGNVLSLGDHWYVLGYGLDLLELRDTQRALERHAAFERLLAEMAGDLLGLPSDRAREGLGAAMAPIVRLLGMDFFSIVTFDDATRTLCLRAEWSKDDNWPGLRSIDGLTMETFPGVMERLTSLNPFLLEVTATLPPVERALRSHLERQGIRSLVLIPMVAAGSVMGFIALGSRALRSVDPQDIPPLKMAGQLVANMLLRIDKDLSLQDREAELEATLVASGEGVLVLDTAGRVIHANQSFADIFEIGEAPVKGTAIQDIATAVKPLLSPGRLECDFLKGKTDSSSAPPDGDWILADGRRLKVNSHPFRRAGAVEGRVCVFRDVTTERNLQLQLQQAQKLESIGRLASGVAHDFNNVLFGITSICDVRLVKPELSERDERDFGSIKRAAERAATLTRQLQAFSRRQVLSIATICLNDVVRTMAGIIPRMIGKHISLRLALNADKGMIRADAHQLEQIILNLTVNAFDAMPNGGELLMETSDVTIVESTEGLREVLPPGQYVQLRVADTGSGMDNALMSRIFDPFFTTKETGKGTGLGLAMVYGIVRQHDGHVEVHSEPGEGTSFEIYLPADTGTPSKGPPEAATPLPRGKGETILIVEDEPIARDATAQILKNHGYRVITAENGGEALNIVGESSIDLLISDVVMPVMGGTELVRQLQEKLPGLRAVFVSGYVNDNDFHRKLENEQWQLLQKPVGMSALLKVVRSLLDS